MHFHCKFNQLVSVGGSGAIKLWFVHRELLRIPQPLVDHCLIDCMNHRHPAAMTALVARSYDQPTGANPMVGGLEPPGWMLAVTPSPKAPVTGSWLASSSMQAGSASSPSRDETWWDPLGHHECIEQDSKANHPVNCLTIHFTHYFRLLNINHYWTCRIIWNPYLDHVGGSWIGYNWYIYTNLWLYYILWMLIISIISVIRYTIGGSKQSPPPSAWQASVSSLKPLVGCSQELSHPFFVGRHQKPKKNRKACCQRWNHQLCVYIHCFLSIYYMILCFLLSMRKPFFLWLEMQTGSL